MTIHSLLRLAEHKALSAVSLTGKVLDLGGEKRSAYTSYLGGNFEVTVLNISPAAGPDVIHDLETPLPVTNNAYEGALLINVLEHVDNYQQLLSEAVRVLKPGGTLVVVVPFLFPVHPSPKDFRRFTEEALRTECSRLSLGNIQIETLGSGVFAAQYLLLDRLMPAPVRTLCYFSVRYLVALFDAVFMHLARLFGKKYDPAHYALGYCLTAKKLPYEKN